MKDITNKTTSDLLKMLSEKQEALRVFRFSAASSKVKNVKEGMSLRKDIARIMTALNAADMAKLSMDKAPSIK